MHIAGGIRVRSQHSLHRSSLFSCAKKTDAGVLVLLFVCDGVQLPRDAGIFHSFVTTN